MSSEVRYIAFTLDETLHAVLDYVRARGRPMPVGDAALAIETNPRISATLTVTRPGTEPAKALTVESDTLAVALVLSCIRNKVPVPVACAKALHAVPNGIVLALGIHLSAQQETDFRAASVPVYDKGVVENRPAPETGTEATRIMAGARVPAIPGETPRPIRSLRSLHNGSDTTPQDRGRRTV